MKNTIKAAYTAKLAAACGVAAGVVLAQPAHADAAVLFAGGNSSQNVLYANVTNILTGGVTNLVISATNSTVRTYQGSIASQPGLGVVTIHFSLLGAVEGLQDLSEQNTETTATGASLVPTVAVSTTSPGAVGINPNLFTANTTLAVPYAFIKNPTSSPNLANVTNLTQRQAAYLEGAAGTLPSAFFGGSSTTDVVYLVPRNTASAVRTEIDANIYFTGTISAWTTNSSGQPIPDPNGGQSSGSAVRALLKAIPESIGTVAAQDISTLTPLAYEGVPFSITNVETGSYPLWYYEQWLYLPTGSQGTPSVSQLDVINTLLGAVTNAGFQATNSAFVGNFVPLSGLQVSRSFDGGPIQSTQY
jgi:hypothetical protein